MKLPSLIFKSVLSQTSVVRRNILHEFNRRQDLSAVPQHCGRKLV